MTTTPKKAPAKKVPARPSLEARVAQLEHEQAALKRGLVQLMLANPAVQEQLTQAILANIGQG